MMSSKRRTGYWQQTHDVHAYCCWVLTPVWDWCRRIFFNRWFAVVDAVFPKLVRYFWWVLAPFGGLLLGPHPNRCVVASWLQLADSCVSQWLATDRLWPRLFGSCWWVLMPVGGLLLAGSHSSRWFLLVGCPRSWWVAASGFLLQSVSSYW